jgi:hypothetical protein
MGRPYHAEAGGHRAGLHFVDAQDLEGGRRPHDVHDGVMAPDLVEVDLVDRPPMEPGLHIGQHGEGVQGSPGDPLGKSGLADQPDDVGMGPHHHRVLGADHGTGGRDAGPKDRLDVERPAAERQPPQQGQHLTEVGAGIEQAAEGHVPGDPREAVEPSQRAGRRSSSVGPGRGADPVHEPHRTGPLTTASGRWRTPPRIRCRFPPR